jgi:hypothetical protein
MIRRSEHSADKKFTLVNRSLAQNKSLSFQARGLLLYVLSKPSKWQAKDLDLQQQGHIGKKALAGIIQELKDAGYLRRTMERKRDGTIHYITEVFEEPEFSKDSAVAQKETTATVAPLPSTAEGTTDNKSTCASAGSLVDLTDLRDSRPKRKSYKPPEPPVIIDPPFHGPAFISALDRYAKVKDEMKSPLTPTMTEALYLKLAKFDEETATIALNEAAAGGYKGVFPEKVNGKGNGNGKYHEQPYTGPVKSKPDLVKENCKQCRGLGTYLKKIDGIDYAFNCNHHEQGAAA